MGNACTSDTVARYQTQSPRKKNEAETTISEEVVSPKSAHFLTVQPKAVTPRPTVGSRKSITVARHLMKQVSQRDITHSDQDNRRLIRRMTEAKFDEKEETDVLKFYADHVDGFVVVDHNGIILNHNKKFSHFFKIANKTFDEKKTDCKGQLITDIVPTSAHKFVLVRMGQSIDGSLMNVDNALPQTFRFLCKTLCLEVTYAKFKISAKSKYYGYLMSFKDITLTVMFEELIQNFFPRQIRESLLAGKEIDSKIDGVTIMFCDIVKYTHIAIEKELRVKELIAELFDQFDEYTDIFGITKIQRIGDCYFAASGLFSDEKKDSVGRMIQFAMKGINYAKSNMDIELRVGIHRGTVGASIVGKKLPQYSLFGTTVIVAARLETTCEAGKIHITNDTLAYTDTSEYVITSNKEPYLKGFDANTTGKSFACSFIHPPSQTTVPLHSFV